MDKTYEEFLADGLDLSPLGFERGAGEAYFCTPRGAEIAGREGVDGVHFCFAPGYGDTLFAVDPSAAAPNFVRAVARDFKDFLRLLLSCGSAAPVEQAHRFTREEFGRYIKSARPSAEGQAALSGLRALGIEPMDDPWGYIHALQEGFDYSRIEYTDPGCIAPERPPEGWAVYYGGGFRGRGRGCPGEETPLGARFDWAGREWRVPAAYSCAQGLVLDIAMRAEADAVRAFMEKWAAADMSGRAARLRAQAENPLECDFTASVCVNGRTLRQKSASGMAWAPLNGLDGDEAARAFVGHYGLDRSCAWALRRVSFPWPRREDIGSLSLTLAARPAEMPGEAFTVSAAGQEVTLRDPFSAREYALRVEDYSVEELPGARIAPKLAGRTFYCAVIGYTLSPEPPEGALRLLDMREGDAGASAAIFTRRAGDGCVACSSLRAQPPEGVEWLPVFRAEAAEDMTAALI